MCVCVHICTYIQTQTYTSKEIWSLYYSLNFLIDMNISKIKS